MTDTIRPRTLKGGVKNVEGGGKDDKEVVSTSTPLNTLDFNNPSAISLLAKDCLMRLKKICTMLKMTGLDVTSYDQNTALLTMEDALARFKAWGSSIAAFHPGLAKTSLDFRLREAGGIRDRALKILEELQEYLHEATLIISGEKENNTWGLDDMSDDSEEEEKQARNDMEPATAKERTSDLDELLSAIITSNASLMKLSMVIRSSPARDDYLKAASKYSTYNPFPDINHVREKHSSAKRSNDWLLERLGKAITRRRQFLLYRVEHHEKLSKWDDEDEKPREEIDEKPEKTIASTKATTFFMGEILTPKPPSDTAVSFGSQTSYEATTAGGEGAASKLTVPSPAKFAFPGVLFEYGEIFQCPYCYTEQTVKNKAAWKKHVFRDLKPYVCTFKGCEMRMFKSRNEWFAHELQNHRREWVCQFCQHDAFLTSATFSKHMSSVHPTILVGSQLEALALQSEEPVDTIPADACPLCNEWEETVSVRHERQGPKMMLLNDGKAKAYGTTKQFRTHLGRHMEQLALFALPMAESDDLEEDGEKTDDDSNTSLGPRSSLSETKEAEETELEKDVPINIGGPRFTHGSTEVQLVSHLTGCYELCNDILLNRRMGPKHEKFDNLQAGLKAASSAIQVEFHNLRKVIGSEIDLSDDPAWRELNHNIRELEVVKTRLYDIAYKRNDDLPGFRDMLRTVKMVEDTSKRVIKDLGERLGSSPTNIPRDSGSGVDEGSLGSDEIVVIEERSNPRSERSVGSSGPDIIVDRMKDSAEETTKILASLVDTKVLIDLGLPYTIESNGSITIQAGLDTKEIDEILRRSRTIIESNFESQDEGAESSEIPRNASTERAAAPGDLEATPSKSFDTPKLTDAEFIQEMQHISDRTNARTMSTAQLQSQQALVGELSDLESPAKAAIAGFHEARANEEPSEGSLRRGRTSSIEFERLTKTYEGATDPSQYVLKESRKVANEDVQGETREAIETFEQPGADGSASELEEDEDFTKEEYIKQLEEDRDRDRERASRSQPQASARTNEYFIPKDGIEREVIVADICRYLGNDALVRPGTYENPTTKVVQQGYFITAYRNLTVAMIADLKADSERWEAERRQAASRGQPSNVDYYSSSTTHQSRQYYSPTEAAPGVGPGYGAQGYQAPTSSVQPGVYDSGYQTQTYAQPDTGNSSSQDCNLPYPSPVSPYQISTPHPTDPWYGRVLNGYGDPTPEIYDQRAYQDTEANLYSQPQVPIQSSTATSGSKSHTSASEQNAVAHSAGKNPYGPLLDPTSEHQIYNTFGLISDVKHCVAVNDVRQFLKSLERNIAEDELDTLIKEADINRDKKLNIDEFTCFMRKYNKLLPK